MPDSIDAAATDGTPPANTRRGREQELWLQHLTRRQSWDYAEALAWIIFRDPAVVASVLGYGKAPLARERANIMAGTLMVYGGEQPFFETCPDKALLYALQAGDVKASGFDNGSSRRRDIRPADWTDLTLNRASPSNDLILGDELGPNAWMAGGHPPCWRSVMFDRETVMATFRAPEPVPEPLPAEPNDTPPSDFDAFEPEVYVLPLLGRAPERARLDDLPHAPEAWPHDLDGAEFLYRGLVRLLWERGGTIQAATSIRRDLAAGRISAFISSDVGRLPIEPHQWEGDASRDVWWGGRALAYDKRGTLREGNVYLLTAAPEPEAAPEPAKLSREPPPPDWWPKPAQTLVSWATDPVVEGEAERRLKAAGVAVTEAAKARAMEVMASETERQWNSSSIEATRRKAR